MEDNNIERLVLDGQNRLTVTKVDSVDGFSEELLKLTVKGKKVIIKGTKIKITQFIKESGNLSADGIFTQINYAGEKKSLTSRLFK